MSAASFVTSVPVIPIATPMSERLSAGASFTPSPVIATTLPWRLSMSTSRTLSSGATRATTPISPTWASSSSSLRAANSVPGSARPSIPSSAAIAAAVVAWSPVIIRTRIPASVQRAIASLASLRGGSTMPTRASSVRSCTCASSSPPGSKLAGSKSRAATASTRSPSPARRSFSVEHTVAGAFDGHRRPLGVPDRGRAREQHVRRSLDEAADDLASVVVQLVERRHELVVGVERDLADTGKRRRVSPTSRPPLAARTTSAASVGSPTISPSRTAASFARAIGRRNGSSEVSDSPATRRIRPSVA